MNKTEIQAHQEQRPWFSLFFLLLLAISGLFLGNFIGALFIVLVYGFSQETLNILQNPLAHPDAQPILLTLQATGQFFGLVVAPIMHITLVDKKPVSALFNTKNLDKVPFFTVFFFNIGSHRSQLRCD